LVKNHPFFDGNKRIGFIVAADCLQLNGWRLEASEVAATLRTLALAAGELSEAEFAVWLRAHSRQV